MLMAGCGRAPRDEAPPEPPLLVMAATSLSEAMNALVVEFESETRMSVDLAIGATGNLAVQMEHGAPADIFFSADQSTVERLVASGRISLESVRKYALGELVVVVRDGVTAPATVADLTDRRFEVIAIANPETAPYGMAAQQALEHFGLREMLSARLVQGEGVAQAFQLVRTGNADAALVARSVVDSHSQPFITIDPASYSPIVHAAGILVDGDHERARLFLDFVMSVDGQKILADHGFRPVTEGR